MMDQQTKPTEDANVQEHRVAVPVDLQIQLAEARLELAQARYELSVRKGSSWDVPQKKAGETPDK